MAVVTKEDIEKAFSLEDQLRNVNGIMDRVFSGSAVAVTSA
jgi:hypothetical protein